MLTQRGYMRANVYDPNNKATDAFNAANTVFAPGASGLTSANVNAAILEVHGLRPGAPTPASETARGIIELATSAEAIAGTDTARAVTPAALGYVLTQRGYMRANVYDPNNKATDAFNAANTVFAPGASGLTSANVNAAILEVHGLRPGAPTPASETARGIIELATSAEAIAGADTVRAITPATLSATITSVAMRKATYDPNNKAADCFAAGNIVFTPGASGLTSANVNAAIVEVAGKATPAGSAGALQYKGATGFAGFGAYGATAKTLNLYQTALKQFRTNHIDLGNISGTYSVGTPDMATSYTATVTGAVTSFGIDALLFDGGQATAVDHVFTVLFQNASGYAITAGSSVKWLNGIAPNFAVAGNHLCTFKKDPRGNVWIGQYNGTVA